MHHYCHTQSCELFTRLTSIICLCRSMCMNGQQKQDEHLLDRLFKVNTRCSQRPGAQEANYTVHLAAAREFDDDTLRHSIKDYCCIDS